MKEELYTIPVNDAFAEEMECPICAMHSTLERNTMDFTLGPSYMEDDVREETNKTGFCMRHVEMLYKEQNRLGLSLMLLTHMDKVIKDTAEAQKQGRGAKTSIFKKAGDGSMVASYLRKVGSSCYVCERIENTLERYILTIFHLYKKDSEFCEKLFGCKGFCSNHYLRLYEEAPKFLSGDKLEEFTKRLDNCYIDNLKRVRDDLEWYTDKFDYRNTDAPWKNSKDAVPRAMLKLNSVTRL